MGFGDGEEQINPFPYLLPASPTGTDRESFATGHTDCCRAYLRDAPLTVALLTNKCSAGSAVDWCGVISCHTALFKMAQDLKQVDYCMKSALLQPARTSLEEGKNMKH